MATRLLLEGPDLEALLDRVRTEHGSDARIVSADRLRKGGVAGFFSKQWFEIGIEVPEPGDPAVPSAQVLSVSDLLQLADKKDGADVTDRVPEPRGGDEPIEEPRSRDPFASFFAAAGGDAANGAEVAATAAGAAARAAAGIAKPTEVAPDEIGPVVPRFGGSESDPVAALRARAGSAGLNPAAAAPTLPYESEVDLHAESPDPDAIRAAALRARAAAAPEVAEPEDPDAVRAAALRARAGAASMRPAEPEIDAPDPDAARAAALRARAGAASLRTRPEPAGPHQETGTAGAGSGAGFGSGAAPVTGRTMADAFRPIDEVAEEQAAGRDVGYAGASAGRDEFSGGPEVGGAGRGSGPGRGFNGAGSEDVGFANGSAGRGQEFASRPGAGGAGRGFTNGAGAAGVGFETGAAGRGGQEFAGGTGTGRGFGAGLGAGFAGAGRGPDGGVGSADVGYASGAAGRGGSEFAGAGNGFGGGMGYTEVGYENGSAARGGPEFAGGPGAADRGLGGGVGSADVGYERGSAGHESGMAGDAGDYVGSSGGYDAGGSGVTGRGGSAVDYAAGAGFAGGPGAAGAWAGAEPAVDQRFAGMGAAHPGLPSVDELWGDEQWERSAVVPPGEEVEPAEFPSVRRPSGQGGPRMFTARPVDAPEEHERVDYDDLLVAPRLPSSPARHALLEEDESVDVDMGPAWPTADEPRLVNDPTPRPRRRWDTPIPKDLLVAMPGKVIVVAGSVQQATTAAEWICARMRLGAGAVQVAGPDQIGRGRILGPEHAADLARDLRRSPVPSVVAIDAAVEDPDGGRWAGAVAKALGANHVVAVVDATRKTADLRRHLADLGGVDALAVYGTTASTDPDSVRELGLPILTIDGVPPTPARRGS
ncbi:hypothetical protein [Actinokineospora enzanensis]|uniref:hypothetical protein n=1 Tax=Actinokineospora enzanensis TaxID=155975 RepID=UPI0003A8DE1C|nr:hypothetical protein [Actinokineospora enzanensis]